MVDSASRDAAVDVARPPRHRRTPQGHRLAQWGHSAVWGLPALMLVVFQIRPVLTCFDQAVLAAMDGTDAVMQSGILAWSARHFWQPAVWVDLPIFYPAGGVIAFMDSLLGQALLLAPLEMLLKPTPAALYNSACLVTLLFSGGAAALLWRASGGDTAGAGFCALTLLGAPFTTWQLGMLNQISSPWIVLMIAALWLGWRRFETGASARRWWWVAAGCLVVQATWGWYGLAGAFFALAVAGIAGCVWAVRSQRLRGLAVEVATPLAAAAAAILVLAWPYLAQRSIEPDYARTRTETMAFSANLNQFLNPGPNRATWDDWLGRGRPFGHRRHSDEARPVLHPGWVTLACAAVGAWRWKRLARDQRRFGLLLAGMGIVGLIMAFGDSIGMPPGGGRRAPLPFGVLQEICVPFRAFRAPVRFSYLLTIALAWWATVGLYSGSGGSPRRGARWGRGAVWLLLWLESVPMGLGAVFLPVDGRPGRDPTASRLPPGAILTLPAPATEQEEDVVEALWLHRVLAHGHPVTGGVSGWVPPATRQLRARLTACEQGTADPSGLLTELRSAGVGSAEVAETLAAPERVRYWDGALRQSGYDARESVSGYRLYVRTGR